MRKIDTDECQLFLAAHYAQQHIDTELEDWELKRKYKNFHGFTCRDFYNEQESIQAIVITEVHGSETFLTIMEDASYKVFLDEMAKKPLFYYVPVISNDGLVFFFEKTMRFDATGILDPKGYKQKPYLLQKLKTIFKPGEVSTLGVEMLVAFPKHKTEEVLRLLENNNLSFNPKLFDLINTSLYQPFMPDISLVIYDFPEDKKLNAEESIKLIFTITSKKGDLTNEEYARIRKLLHKVRLEEFENIESIIFGFREGDEKLYSLVENEKNRKKNKLLWKKLYQATSNVAKESLTKDLKENKK